MKHLYILVPTIECANTLVGDLQKWGIPRKDILFFGKDLQQLDVPNLHEAGLLVTSDLLRALVRGIISGGIAGITAGILVINFPPSGLKLGLGTVFGLGILGIAFGAWVSTLIGISVPSPLLEKYEKDIEEGELLVLIEVSKEAELQIRSKIKKRHPSVKIVGILPSIMKLP